MIFLSSIVSKDVSIFISLQYYKFIAKCSGSHLSLLLRTKSYKPKTLIYKGILWRIGKTKVDSFASQSFSMWIVLLWWLGEKWPTRTVEHCEETARITRLGTLCHWCPCWLRGSCPIPHGHHLQQPLSINKQLSTLLHSVALLKGRLH